MYDCVDTTGRSKHLVKIRYRRRCVGEGGLRAWRWLRIRRRRIVGFESKGAKESASEFGESLGNRLSALE